MLKGDAFCWAKYLLWDLQWHDKFCKIETSLHDFVLELTL